MTVFLNRSQVEILESTNMFRCGPHEPPEHLDEIELMPREIDEAFQINTKPIKLPGQYTGRTAKGRARRT